MGSPVDQGYALAFSHVGFFIVDMARMVDFYRNTLGFFVTDKGVLNGKAITFLSRDPNEHHQIVLVAGREPGTHQNINQISFRVRGLGELKRLHERLLAANTTDLEPVIHGNAWSIYCRDPEGNRLEIFADSDWYISQPFKEPLDLSMSEEDIRAWTLDYCKDREGFKPIEEWRAGMRRMMASGWPGDGDD